MTETKPTDPAEVWDMIRRADDLVKYAPNRDARTAHAQARDQLERAARAAESLADRRAGEALAAQVQTRFEDLDRLDG